jgi:hypothetical protein
MYHLVCGSGGRFELNLVACREGRVFWSDRASANERKSGKSTRPLPSRSNAPSEVPKALAKSRKSEKSMVSSRLKSCEFTDAELKTKIVATRYIRQNIALPLG